ncbi:MAG: aminopeptidase family protein P, partial [Alphaproteobacteria bacterium]|nr:aminopeptidase family protein P [Alphaproteobacteria bacterium]
VVLRDSAALFSDGRYTLQMATETDPAFWSCHTIVEPDQMAHWIGEQAPNLARIGFDASLISPPQLERWQKATRDKGLVFVPLATNPLHGLWRDRPAAPATRPWPHPAEWSGESHPLKLARVVAELQKINAEAAVLTSPESIAWLLNIRANDSEVSPIALSFAILRQSDREGESLVEWFIEPDRCDPDLRTHLGPAVSITPPRQFMARLKDLGAAKTRVLCDPQTSSVRILNQLQESGAVVIHGSDPCLLPKSLKNPVEIAGSRAAHHRDGVAMVQLLAWLDESRGDSLTELTVAAKIREFRQSLPRYHSDSFETIAAAGANAALPHYHPTADHDARLQNGAVFLLDCGAQYHDGTTDITRTVWFGAQTSQEPPAELRENFTRVLQGHIALARAVFPQGTTGSQLDCLARQFLWRAGKDFDHGTGHGVGSFLSVHEGPQRISKIGSTTGLQPGMIISNEPGYYRPGAYGIRLENLVVVTELATQPGYERKMLGFETLTLAPFDLRLVYLPMLDGGEIAWLNHYHQRVWAALSPELQGDELAWLKRATKAVVT